MQLTTSLKDVLRTTKDHLAALEAMNVRTVEDLLFYLPRAHEDLSQMQTLASAPLETKVTIRGTVDTVKLVRTRHGKQLVTARFTDHEGDQAEVIWFNQPHVKRMLTEGDEIVLTGKLVEKGYRLQFLSPTFEKDGNRPLVHAGRLVPIYPQHDQITTKWLREKIVLVKDAINMLEETLPPDLLAQEKIVSRREAIRSLHFPANVQEVEKAYERMAFEEMYRMQYAVLEKKRAWQEHAQERLRTNMDVELIRTFFQSLNFTPTDSQRIAIYEILRDMERDVPMSRLLEGDVGSGKTLVATAVIANVIRSGGQCALMVPTEVLARQHVIAVGKMLVHFHSYVESLRKKGEQVPFHFPLPTIELLTGSLPAADARRVRQRLERGTVDLVIGTHALIMDSVQFQDLKLVIVDEQHRFGVEQRQRLQEKGCPHFLAMTATPIPRTLALTAYGHHDLSVLLEKPGNRQPVQTKVVSPADRKTVERFIDQQISQGRQVFVICPLIQVSQNTEMSELKNVQTEVQRLQTEFPHRKIASLHGQMHTQEKTAIMKAFHEKQSDILVSTSVIEVGIDVPNATIIVIEGAERFGLAQLHQFRGRVGRGEHKSHCFLFTTTPQQARSLRLKAMEEHDSGFVLAEIDLKLRGPGELYGVRQSGIPDMHLARMFQPELVVRARRAAEKALGMDLKIVT
ncbi:MAG: ATP-dependent DNA helicase RecG [Candidatus Peribacteraceae bacterium]